MKELELLENPDYIIMIIEKLTKQFETETFQKFNGHTRDALSFYIQGHAFSFARILNEVFNDLGKFYYNDNHVVTKLGSHYYDIWGMADELVKNEEEPYQECPKDYFLFLEDCSKKDEHSDEIEQELIAFGKFCTYIYKHKDCKDILIRKLGIHKPISK